MNLALLAFISVHAPAYLADYRLNTNADAIHYVRLGENFWQRGVYSRQEEPPYVPDVHRTPLYPLVAGGVTSVLHNVWPLYMIQLIGQLATVAAVVALVRTIASRRVAIAVGTLAALDLSAAIANWQALSEPIFVCLSTVTVLAWSRLVASREDRIPVGFVVGALAGVAALTRPQGFYLGLILALLTIAWGFVVQARRQVFQGLALTAGLLVVVAPWVARNYSTFGIARLSTIDSLTMAYYAGAGVYQLRDGIDARAAEAQVAEEFGLVPKNVAHNYWLTSKSPAELDAEQMAAARAIVARYPVLVAESGLLGIVQAGLSHNTADLASAAGLTWRPPGLARLVRGDVHTALRELAANGPLLGSVFVFQVLYMPLLAVLAVAGAARGLLLGDRTARTVYSGLVLSILYFGASIAVHGLGADARFRAPIVPLACACAGCAIPTWRGRFT